MANRTAALSARSLSYSYSAGTRVLDGVSFDVAPGEYVALLGANGSGKSTLLKLASALLLPEPGTLLIGSLDGSVLDPGIPGSADSVRRAFTLVMQNPDDQIVATVAEEDVAFGPRNLGLDPMEIKERVDDALAAVGLERLRKRPPHLLSGGERQRLALAGALAMGSGILALDEASSMADPSARRSFLDLVDRLAGGSGPAPRTVLHVTHSMEDAARAGRVLVLSRGRLVFDGSAGDLFRRPELEAWSLELPEALRCARALREKIPGLSAFFPDELEPEAFAALAAEAVEAAGSAAPDAPQAAGAAESAAPDAAPQVDGTAVSAEASIKARAAAAGLPALDFDAVSYRYLPGTVFESSALASFDAAFPAGRATALLGRSGSGKSTALKHANGLLLPSSGAVRALGVDTRDRSVSLKALRLRAVLSPQNPESALFERWVGDDVAYGPRNKGLAGKALVASVRDAMDRAGLPYAEFRDRESSRLSGGERRKAALAGAFAMDAELYLFDEPCAALDRASSRRVLEAVLSLRSRGAAVVATTHSMEDAARFDAVAVVQDGRVAAQGSPASIFYDAYDPAWGLERPWAVRAALAARAAGLPVRGSPLTPEALAAALVPAAAGSAAGSAPAVAAPSVPAAAPDRVRPPAPAKRRRGGGVDFFRNATLGQFLDRPSPLLDLRPADKFLGLFALAAPALCGSGFAAPLVVLGLVLLLGALARVGPRHLLRGLLPALPYFGLIALFQVLFSWPGDTSAVYFRFGPLDATAAELQRAGLFVLRMGVFMALLSLFSAVTSLSQMLQGIDGLLRPLGRLGLPARDLGAVVGVAFRFVPVLAEEAERIVVAQLSRGGGYEGASRLRGGLALTVPLFLRALERAQGLASALELRLYSVGCAAAPAVPPRRTSLGRWVLRLVLMVFSALLSGWALGLL